MTPLLQQAQAILLLDYTDAKNFTTICNFFKSNNVDKIISLSEVAQIVSAKIGIELGLKDANKLTVTRILQHKQTMRQHLGNLPFNIKSYECNNDTQTNAAVAKIGSACIVKPVAGVGSKNVFQVAANTKIATLDIRYPSIVERFVDGVEYSVESFSHKNNHSHIAITEKSLYGGADNSIFVEQSHKIGGHIDSHIRQKNTANC